MSSISMFSSGRHFVQPNGTSREPYKEHLSKIILTLGQMWFRDFSILISGGHLVLQSRIFRQFW